MHLLLDHIVLNVEDAEKMTAFYTDVLKMSPERLDAYREGKVPFPSVRLNAVTVIDLFPKGLWASGTSGGIGFGSLNHFCIAMDRSGWQDLVDRLAEREIAIEEGPVPRWGARGQGTSVYFRDPEGNLIEGRYYQEKTGTGTCLLGS